MVPLAQVEITAAPAQPHTSLAHITSVEEPAAPLTVVNWAAELKQ